MPAVRPNPRLSQRRGTPPRDLVRVLLGYLCLVLLLQALAAASAAAGGRALQHRHRPTAFTQHDRLHHDNQRHEHAAQDGSVVAVPSLETTLDAAAEVLAAAVALLLVCSSAPSRDAPRRRAWRATAAWACCSGFCRAHFRPPRLD